MNKTQENDTAKKKNKLLLGLRKTRNILTADIGDLLQGKKKIDDDLIEELETRLLMADVGVETTQKIIDELSKKLTYGSTDHMDNLTRLLSELIEQLLTTPPLEIPEQTSTPYSILIVGTNGSGKTTTIGKLTHWFMKHGKDVVLAAGDTFRAAAVEQLQSWGEKNHVPVIAQQPGADPAAVIFDALNSAAAKNADILIADTAGRLHTHNDLMQELQKIKRVMAKFNNHTPDETWLVIDATMGQNALVQANEFNKAIGLTGLIITKLDGTAKGGIVLAIKNQLNLPIRFIGVGEARDDLQAFSAKTFAEALLRT